MTTATEAPTKSGPRGKLRAWFEARIDGLDEFDIPTIQAEAERQFLADPEWTTSMFGSLLGNELRHLITQLRPRGIVLGDTATSREGMKARADRLAKKWNAWTEHIPDGGYVRLMAMTRPQLLATAAERRDRGMVEIRTARLLEVLAAQLKSDDQRVREHFSPGQIEAIEHDILSEG